jgi:hypothetical protein
LRTGTTALLSLLSLTLRSLTLRSCTLRSLAWLSRALRPRSLRPAAGSARLTRRQSTFQSPPGLGRQAEGLGHPSTRHRHGLSGFANDASHAAGLDLDLALDQHDHCGLVRVSREFRHPGFPGQQFDRLGPDRRLDNRAADADRRCRRAEGHAFPLGTPAS